MKLVCGELSLFATNLSSVLPGAPELPCDVNKGLFYHRRRECIVLMRLQTGRPWLTLNYHVKKGLLRHRRRECIVLTANWARLPVCLFAAVLYRWLPAVAALSNQLSEATALHVKANMYITSPGMATSLEPHNDAQCTRPVPFTFTPHEGRFGAAWPSARAPHGAYVW